MSEHSRPPEEDTGPAATANVMQPGSSSLSQPDYWWYRARSQLLETTLSRYVDGAERVLDVGSADGPSVAWLQGKRVHATVDVVPTGLVPGTGICSSALALPFRDESFDVVSAFDVLEHLEPEARGMHELARVLALGGRLLMSVPAYRWAWSEHDVRAGHYRRYTRRRLLDAVRGGGLRPLRCSYAFTSVFPFFVAERGIRLVRARRGTSQGRLTPVSPRVDRVLMRLSSLDERLLRGHDLPFGSSVLVAAVKDVPTPALADAR